jgi:hypothetical protein
MNAMNAGPGPLENIGNVDAFCGADCGEDCPTSRTQWMVTLDALILVRTPGNSYPLLVKPAPTQHAPPYTYNYICTDISDIGYSGVMGYRLTASRMSADCCWGVELGFMGLTQKWETNKTCHGILQLNGPNFTVGSDPDLHPPTPLAFRVHTDSDLYGLDLNVLHGFCDWGTLRAGVRWIHFDDALFVDELYTPMVGVLRAYVDNDMIGPQVGMDLKLLEAFCCRFRLTGTMNVGVFFNHAEGCVCSSYVGPPLGVESNQVSVMGEASLMAKYRVANNVAVRVGYQILGIQNTALAGDQIASADRVSEIATMTMGSLFAHGAIVGVEVFW